MNDRTCTIDGCDHRYLASGFCNKHYQRNRRYGDPLHVTINRGNIKPRPVPTHRTCIDCGKRGSVDGFTRGRNVCIPCRAIRGRVWKSENPGRVSASRLRNAAATLAREEIRKATRKGLDPAVVQAHRERHGDTCDICGGPPIRKSFAVDHDHITGVFRGLLCDHCNLALGLLKDDPIRIRAAARYLERVPGPLSHNDA